MLASFPLNLQSSQGPRTSILLRSIGPRMNEVSHLLMSSAAGYLLTPTSIWFFVADILMANDSFVPRVSFRARMWRLGTGASRTDRSWIDLPFRSNTRRSRTVLFGRTRSALTRISSAILSSPRSHLIFLGSGPGGRSLRISRTRTSRAFQRVLSARAFLSKVGGFPLINPDFVMASMSAKAFLGRGAVQLDQGPVHHSLIHSI